MNQVDQTHINDRAMSLARDAIRLHILSYQMGQGLSKEDDYRACQRIIAEAASLERDIASMVAQ